MAKFQEKYGPWALITGASSGLGLNFAHQLAEGGLHLALVARREERLKELAAQLENKHGIKTKIVPLDLAREDFLPELKKATSDLDIGLVINNAGFANSGDLVDNPLERELQLLHVNCRAVLIVAHEYGKRLKARRKGGMIIVSSVAGFSGIPIWTNYAASKAYDLYLAEGMGAELKPFGVDVLALCPGATRTEFGKVSGTTPFMAMEADDVVRHALKKLGKKRVAVAGLMNKFNTMSTRFQPRSWNVKIFGVFIKHMQKS